MTTTINADNGVSSGSAGLKQTADNSGVLALQTNGTTALTLDASQNATFAGSITSAGATGSLNSINTFGFKNRIINGGMTIDQRNAGASTTPAASTYLVDRFKVGIGGAASKYSFQQSTVAPTGFTNSLLATVVSAYSVAATDIISLQQLIEGYNVADLGWGTASAKTVTLSFWVRCSVTGTFGGSFVCIGATTSYNPFSYTINAANTWEQKTITVTGPTTNPGYTDSNAGISIYWSLGVGSTYTGATGSWGTTQYRNATGAVSLVANAGATFYITGVQLEVGSQATSFDFRSATQELALCQRYYEKSYSQGTVPASSTGVGACWFPYSGVNCFSTFPFATEKRTDATMLIWDTAGNSNCLSWGNGAAGITTGVSQGVPVQYAGTRNVTLRNSNGISGTPVVVGYHWTASAEL